MKRTRIDRFKVKNKMPSAPTPMKSLEDLADAAELSQTTIYAALDSYSWRGATLDAIAAALGCDPLIILTVDEVEQPAHVAERLAALGLALPVEPGA